jgi:hypothetical protein
MTKPSEASAAYCFQALIKLERYHTVKNFALAAAIVASLTVPSMAVANNASTAGPILCSQVKAGETANATMGSTQLSCQPMNTTEIRAAMKTIEGVMHQLHPSDVQEAQMHAAMTQFSGILELPVTPGGNGGVED